MHVIRWAAGAALALSAACLAAPAQAQSVALSAIEVPAAGTCPDAQLSQLPGMQANPQSLARGQGDTFIVKQEKLQQTSGRASAPIEPEVKLFEKAIIYGVDERSEKLLVGLIRGSARICGWANVSADWSQTVIRAERFIESGRCVG